MTHPSKNTTKFHFDEPEHEPSYYIRRAHELRHEAVSQMMSDARHNLAQAYHATTSWIAQHLHRHPSTHA